MDPVKTDNEGELTSTMDNVISVPSKDEKSDTSSDATPTSSTDANIRPAASHIALDDPISSTSSDSLDQIKVKMDKGDSASVNTHRVSTDNEADLLDMTNITNSEKITEDVEDLVHDLESLLGESTDSFNVTSKFSKRDTSLRPGSGNSSNDTSSVRENSNVAVDNVLHELEEMTGDVISSKKSSINTEKDSKAVTVDETLPVESSNSTIEHEPKTDIPESKLVSDEHSNAEISASASTSNVKDDIDDTADKQMISESCTEETKQETFCIQDQDISHSEPKDIQLDTAESSTGGQISKEMPEETSKLEDIVSSSEKDSNEKRAQNCIVEKSDVSGSEEVDRIIDADVVDSKNTSEENSDAKESQDVHNQKEDIDVNEVEKTELGKECNKNEEKSAEINEKNENLETKNIEENNENLEIKSGTTEIINSDSKLVDTLNREIDSTDSQPSVSYSSKPCEKLDKVKVDSELSTTVDGGKYEVANDERDLQGTSMNQVEDKQNTNEEIEEKTDESHEHSETKEIRTATESTAEENRENENVAESNSVKKLPELLETGDIFVHPSENEVEHKDTDCKTIESDLKIEQISEALDKSEIKEIPIDQPKKTPSCDQTEDHCIKVDGELNQETVEKDISLIGEGSSEVVEEINEIIESLSEKTPKENLDSKSDFTLPCTNNKGEVKSDGERIVLNEIVGNVSPSVDEKENSTNEPPSEMEKANLPTTEVNNSIEYQNAIEGVETKQKESIIVKDISDEKIVDDLQPNQEASKLEHPAENEQHLSTEIQVDVTLSDHVDMKTMEEQPLPNKKVQNEENITLETPKTNDDRDIAVEDPDDDVPKLVLEADDENVDFPQAVIVHQQEDQKLDDTEPTQEDYFRPKENEIDENVPKVEGRKEISVSPSDTQEEVTALEPADTISGKKAEKTIILNAESSAMEDEPTIEESEDVIKPVEMSSIEISEVTDCNKSLEPPTEKELSNETKEPTENAEQATETLEPTSEPMESNEGNEESSGKVPTENAEQATETLEPTSEPMEPKESNEESSEKVPTENAEQATETLEPTSEPMESNEGNEESSGKVPTENAEQATETLEPTSEPMEPKESNEESSEKVPTENAEQATETLEPTSEPMESKDGNEESSEKVPTENAEQATETLEPTSEPMESKEGNEESSEKVPTENAEQATETLEPTSEPIEPKESNEESSEKVLTENAEQATATLEPTSEPMESKEGNEESSEKVPTEHATETLEPMESKEGNEESSEKVPRENAEQATETFEPNSEPMEPKESNEESSEKVPTENAEQVIETLEPTSEPMESKEGNEESSEKIPTENAEQATETFEPMESNEESSEKVPTENAEQATETLEPTSEPMEPKESNEESSEKVSTENAEQATETLDPTSEPMEPKESNEESSEKVPTENAEQATETLEPTSEPMESKEGNEESSEKVPTENAEQATETLEPTSEPMESKEGNEESSEKVPTEHATETLEPMESKEGNEESSEKVPRENAEQATETLEPTSEPMEPKEDNEESSGKVPTENAEQATETLEPTSEPMESKEGNEESSEKVVESPDVQCESISESTKSTETCPLETSEPGEASLEEDSKGLSEPIDVATDKMSEEQFETDQNEESTKEQSEAKKQAEEISECHDDISEPETEKKPDETASSLVTSGIVVQPPHVEESEEISDPKEVLPTENIEKARVPNKLSGKIEESSVVNEHKDTSEADKESVVEMQEKTSESGKVLKESSPVEENDKTAEMPETTNPFKETVNACDETIESSSPVSVTKVPEENIESKEDVQLEEEVTIIEECKSSISEIIEQDETALAVASLEGIDMDTNAPILTEKEKQEMEALRKAVESISDTNNQVNQVMEIAEPVIEESVQENEVEPIVPKIIEEVNEETDICEEAKKTVNVNKVEETTIEKVIETVEESKTGIAEVTEDANGAVTEVNQTLGKINAIAEKVVGDDKVTVDKASEIVENVFKEVNDEMVENAEKAIKPVEETIEAVEEAIETVEDATETVEEFNEVIGKTNETVEVSEADTKNDDEAPLTPNEKAPKITRNNEACEAILPDSSQSLSDVEADEQVQDDEEKESKPKTNERPRRHKKSSDNKTEDLSTTADTADKEKPYSPKVTIKPIKVPDEEVSTTTNSENEAGKGSLKMTITKQSDKMHSILKVCDVEQAEAIQEQEEPLPKLKIKSKPGEQASPKMSTRSSRQAHQTANVSQRSSSPRITIKPVVKPETLSPLKIKIGLKADETTKKHSPKLNIKPIPKQEEESKETAQSPKKVIIKNIVKPPEEEEQAPKITIKPIPKPDLEKEALNISPKLNIKPIKKPEEEENDVEKISPKITIKPIVKPPEPDSHSDEVEDDSKKRIVLKINKGNLPAKEARKREHPPEDDKAEKLAKITVKFSKEGGHPHIVQQSEEAQQKRPHEEPNHIDKNKKQKLDQQDTNVSTRSKQKEHIIEPQPETKKSNPSEPTPESSENPKPKQSFTDNPGHGGRGKHKDGNLNSPIESKRSKLRESKQKDNPEVTKAEDVAERAVVNSPVSTTDDIGNTSVHNPGPEPITPRPNLELTVSNPSSESSTPITPILTPPQPRKRGRPRKIPLEQSPSFETPSPQSKKLDTPTQSKKLDTPPTPGTTDSGRPKRSCRGQSALDTLGLKPRKPRGSRGRGRPPAGESRAISMKPEKSWK